MKRLSLLFLLCAWLPAAGQSFEPFTFVQMSDTQIGFMDRSPGYGQSDSLMMAAVAAVNAVDPAFILLTGDLVNDPYDAVQDSIYRVRLAELKAPVHIIPGNHDMKGFSEEEHAHYMSMRGSDRFSFRSHDCAFIGFDSNCILDKATEFEAAQKAWLEAELAAARGSRHIFVFLHCPIIREVIDERVDNSNGWTIPISRWRNGRSTSACSRNTALLPSSPGIRIRSMTAYTTASVSSPPGPWATPSVTASLATKWSA